MANIDLRTLPDDVAAHIALNRVLSTAEAAAYCNLSTPHWRRLLKAGKVPQPVRLSTRKLGWRLGTLIAFHPPDTPFAPVFHKNS